MDIENLNDSREFFADHERHENGKQEIHNQIGGDVCALRRKRVRFSLKPDSIRPIVSTGPALDIWVLANIWAFRQVIWFPFWTDIGWAIYHMNSCGLELGFILGRWMFFFFCVGCIYVSYYVHFVSPV